MFSSISPSERLSSQLYGTRHLNVDRLHRISDGPSEKRDEIRNVRLDWIEPPRTRISQRPAALDQKAIADIDADTHAAFAEPAEYAPAKSAGDAAECDN